jgi:TPR repeat protein
VINSHKLFGFSCALGCAILTTSCSITPGDAAFSSGHFEDAARLYGERASIGDALAAFKLATMYDGTNWTRAELGRDEAKAIEYYERAFELGHLTAPAYIGAIYEVGGIDVPIDYDQARIWYEKGAELGQHTSMYSLAGLYSRKLVRPSDDVTGLMWVEIARIMARAHSQNVGTEFILSDRKGYWRTLRNRMSDSEILLATEKASEFVRTYKPPQHGELDPPNWTS